MSTYGVFFQENGYLSVEGVFAPSEMDALSRRIEDIETGRMSFPENDLVWEPTDKRRLRNIFGMIHRDPLFRSIAVNEKLVDIVEELLGPDLDIYGDGLFAKPAREGSVVPAHQDMAHWSFHPHEMLTAWVALEDANEENGCLRVIPGSHRLGLVEHKPSGVVGNSKMVADESLVNSSRELAIELKKGSVGFHHCLTIHRSNPNRSERSRRAYTVIFMSGAAEWTGESTYRFPFVHVRGKASPAYHQMKDVPL